MSNQPLTRKQMREQAEEIARKQREAANQVQEEVVKQVDIDDEGNPQFKVSNVLTGEVTGTNLIVEIPKDITSGGSIITDSGELVITGSIDISGLITPTGEIDIIQTIDDTDSDLDNDAQAGYIPGIPPIRASGVIAKTQGQPGMPGGAHRGMNPYLYFGLLTLAALLIGGGVTVALIYGFFK
jgi:hypothetical protein